MKKLLLTLPLVFLLAAGCNSQQPVVENRPNNTQPAQNQPSTPIPATNPVQQPTPTNIEAGWTIYTNAQFGYSIQYPKGWFVNPSAGGTLQIANEANIDDYFSVSLDKPPKKTKPQGKELAELDLIVTPIKNPEAFTPQVFCKGTPYSNAIITNITINGLSGQTCAAYFGDQPSGNIKITYLNGSTYQYRFIYRPNSFIKLEDLSEETIQKMDSIAATFKLN